MTERKYAKIYYRRLVNLSKYNKICSIPILTIYGITTQKIFKGIEEVNTSNQQDLIKIYATL